MRKSYNQERKFFHLRSSFQLPASLQVVVVVGLLICKFFRLKFGLLSEILYYT